MWYIYAHKNNQNEIVYIGTGIKKRLTCAHYNKPTYSKLWNNYFKDYRPVVEVLIEGLTQEEAYLQETLAIKEFSPLLNQKSGGKNGKISKSIEKSKYTYKNEPYRPNKKGTNHPRFGKHQSATSKALNAASNGAKPFYAVKLDCGIVFGPYFYQRQAADCLGIPKNGNISSCIHGHLPSYKGYKFIAMEL